MEAYEESSNQLWTLDASLLPSFLKTRSSGKNRSQVVFARSQTSDVLITSRLVVVIKYSSISA